jgi:hypothetical protein
LAFHRETSGELDEAFTLRGLSAAHHHSAVRALSGTLVLDAKIHAPRAAQDQTGKVRSSA